MANPDQGHLLLSSNTIQLQSKSQSTKKSGKFRGSAKWLIQFLSAISVSLLSLGHGASEIWTSPALPYLKSNESEIIITTAQSPWITSIYNFGGLLGLFVYPLLVDRIGRKYTLLILYLFQITSWILIIFAKSTEFLYVARTFSGTGYIAGFIVQSMYLGEISEKRIRGTLVLTLKIFYCLGSLIVVTAGAFFTYNTMNLILLLISILFIVTFPFLPESPYFYLKNNRDQDAIKSLSKLRETNDSEELKKEINRIKEDIIEGQAHEKCALRMLIETKRHRKALLIASIANVTLPLSGILTVMSYSQEIFNFSGISMQPKYAVILLTFVSLIFILISTPFADYFGRRILTLYSGIISALSLGFVGVFFFFKHNPEFGDLSSISWMLLVAMIIYNISSAAGFVSSAIILPAELFSVEVKSAAMSFLHILLDLFSFLVKLAFESSVEILGIYNIFWIYAVFCLILPLVNFWIMPETKGKTLEEIQKLLN